MLEHCYRHPNREAGRRCTRCGKPACSECLVQAAVGSHCLDCAKAARPDVKTRAKFWTAGQSALVSRVLIGINVAVFLWVVAGDSAALGFNSVTQRLFDLGLSKELLQGITFRGQTIVESHEWYRLVTNGFIHFGILHLLMNMYSLYILGRVLEPVLGGVKFGLLYAAGLLGGSAGVLLLGNNAISGGASGAIFALLAAGVIAMWRQGVSPMQSQLGQLFLLNIFITFIGSRYISVGGHLGGAAAGAICGFVMLAPRWKPVPDWAKYATPVAVAIAAVAISVAVVG